MVLSQLSHLGKLVLEMLPNVMTTPALGLLFGQQNLVAQVPVILFRVLVEVSHLAARHVSVLDLAVASRVNFKCALSFVIVSDWVLCERQVHVNRRCSRGVNVMDSAFGHQVKGFVKLRCLHFFSCLIEVSNNDIVERVNKRFLQLD